VFTFWKFKVLFILTEPIEEPPDEFYDESRPLLEALESFLLPDALNFEAKPDSSGFLEFGIFFFTMLPGATGSPDLWIELFLI